VSVTAERNKKEKCVHLTRKSKM